MSAFGGLFITNMGRNLQLKAQTGVQLEFTRIAVGDGRLGSSIIFDLNALKNEIKSMPVERIQVITDGKALVSATLSNQELESGFYFREVGVFAEDPDEGEILYCYGNAAELAEYIPADGGADVVEKVIEVLTIVGNAENVSATIDQSLAYLTVKRYEEEQGTISLETVESQVRPAINEINSVFTSHVSDSSAHHIRYTDGEVQNVVIALLQAGRDINLNYDDTNNVLNISATNTKPGTFIWFAGNTPPDGYLECNGAAISRTAYSNLFSVIGTTFGDGDGSTTFNIPDLRGEFIRGWDNGRGVDSGRNFGSWQEDEFKSHNHSFSQFYLVNVGGVDGEQWGSGYRTSYTGNRGGDETRPRNVALLPCIKY